MQEAVLTIKESIYSIWFALFIFFSGFCFSYMVNLFNIKFLKWFPVWFVRVMSRFINPRAGFMKIFLIIFLFNSISIAIYMLSGLFVILPLIIAFLTGMNVGLTVFIPPRETMEGYEPGRTYRDSNIIRMIVFSTFVMVIEMVIFSVALGMGISLGISVSAVSAADPSASTGAAMYIADLLFQRLNAYFLICVPALAVSAYMEAVIIKGA